MGDLVVSDLHFSYPGSSSEVLSGGTICLRSGSPWVLEGANGAGKSTWLKVVAGLLPCGRASITLDGSGLHRGQVSYSDPIPALFDELSALEHMHLVSEMWRMGNVASVAYVSAVTGALGSLQMPDLHLRVEDYSSGMREKLSLCLILLREASVVLLDEPLTATDAASRDTLVSMISGRAKRDIVIVVSHIPEVASMLKASVINLANGVVHET